MWVNPELNASEAFVAAWLPGTEGGGVADVIFRTAEGAIDHDFTGRLAHSWPRTATQTPLNVGEPGYDPLFALGFGLTAGEDGELGLLAEDSREAVSATGRAVFFDGAPVAPWQLFVGDPRNQAVKTVAGAATTWDRDNLVVRPVDRDRQEDARAARWGGFETASLYLGAAQTVDLTAQAGDGMSLAFDVMVEEPPSAPVFAAMRCGEDCEGRIDITGDLGAIPPGNWTTLKVSLSAFRDAGADLDHITAPWVLATEGTLALRIAHVRLEPGE